MNDELILALHSSEWAEAKLLEFEQKNIYLKCINVLANEKGWSDTHRRMAQLLVLADAFESLKEQNCKLAAMQPGSPIIIQQPPKPEGDQR